MPGFQFGVVGSCAEQWMMPKELPWTLEYEMSTRTENFEVISFVISGEFYHRHSTLADYSKDDRDEDQKARRKLFYAGRGGGKPYEFDRECTLTRGFALAVTSGEYSMPYQTVNLDQENTAHCFNVWAGAWKTGLESRIEVLESEESDRRQDFIILASPCKGGPPKGNKRETPPEPTISYSIPIESDTVVASGTIEPGKCFYWTAGKWDDEYKEKRRKVFVHVLSTKHGRAVSEATKSQILNLPKTQDALTLIPIGSWAKIRLDGREDEADLAEGDGAFVRGLWSGDRLAVENVGEEECDVIVVDTCFSESELNHSAFKQLEGDDIDPEEMEHDVEETGVESRPRFLETPFASSSTASSGLFGPASLSTATRRAILFALEEALRHPHLFTPDLVEESASMATVSDGGALGSPRRPVVGPVLTGSPPAIRGPRVIMQERAAREARQKAEAEKLAMERARAEQEARLSQEAQRRASELRVMSGPDPQHLIDPRHHTRPEPSQAARIPDVTASIPLADAQLPHPDGYSHAGGRQQQPPILGDQAVNDPAKPRSSFPHAFERWETLSAHWEGLTSYWIRKLEQNKDEVNRDPLSQQLARQVTDLSAAGANLFHAVVELQRLRASSERKFQRWFFETRAELERAREVNAMMDAALQKERQDRAEAIRDAIDQERGSTKIQKQLVEMRKELSISKEEARRAWEELGRREQEERDRTYSLQTGQPTMVGGVQVVPMTHGGLSRNGSAREPPDEYARGPGYQAEHPRASSPPRTPPSALQSEQQQQQQQQQSQGRGRGGPEGGHSQGEYETPTTTGHEPPSTTTTTAGETPWTGEFADAQDYSGQGYGAPGWETVPRHHHPTRLSDVIEEDDERSRTSASLMSRG
ncbi:hypothetical protein GQ602_000803 [Ophiocordyceps camponoti-floridani]|uniref:Uncharacterized protein n=1 Tax=Ophiocordyceps camponoti-floridani TaxID=2030778 RepID=A0A8H4QCT9_9HYPO|nr:hypothetical protein GQ602_000803 [Ophiocordyceps camponoti-floridani]